MTMIMIFSCYYFPHYCDTETSAVPVSPTHAAAQSVDVRSHNRRQDGHENATANDTNSRAESTDRHAGEETGRSGQDGEGGKALTDRVMEKD